MCYLVYDILVHLWSLLNIIHIFVDFAQYLADRQISGQTLAWIVIADYDSFRKVGYPGVCNARDFILESRCWFPPHERHIYKTVKYKMCELYVCVLWITKFSIVNQPWISQQSLRHHLCACVCTSLRHHLCAIVYMIRHHLCACVCTSLQIFPSLFVGIIESYLFFFFISTF